MTTEDVALEAERLSVLRCSDDLVRFAAGVTTYTCPRCQTEIRRIRRYPWPACPQGCNVKLVQTGTPREDITDDTDAWLVDYLPVLAKAVVQLLESYPAFDPPVSQPDPSHEHEWTYHPAAQLYRCDRCGTERTASEFAAELAPALIDVLEHGGVDPGEPEDAAFDADDIPW